MSTQRAISRRQVLGQALSTAATGIMLPHFIAGRSWAAQRRGPSFGKPGSPNEEIHVGIIGCGRRNGQLVIGKGGQGEPPA